MANLIPPDAKKALQQQYWIRVVTVWSFIVGVGFIVATILHAPTFVLVQSQLSSGAGQFDSAKEKEDSFNQAQTTIVEANALAALLVSESSSDTKMTELIDILDTIGGSDIEINLLSFKSSMGVISQITVNGEAATRAALAAFSDDLEAHPLFLEAEVPISNLAKDRDITFNIKVVPDSSI